MPAGRATLYTPWPFVWRQPPPTQRRMCPERAAVCHRVCVGICSRHGPALQHRHTAQFGDGVRQPGPLRVSRCRAHASSPKPWLQPSTHICAKRGSPTLPESHGSERERKGLPAESDLKPPAPPTFREGAAGAATTRTEWRTPLGRMLARAPGSHSLLTCMSSSRSRARTLARVALGRLQSLGGASALRRFTRLFGTWTRSVCPPAGRTPRA